jgi:hypothetical protein
MKNNSSLFYSLLLIIGDFVALLSAFIVAYILRVRFDPRPLIEQIPAVDFAVGVAIILPLWIIIHALIGLYSYKIHDRRFFELGGLMVGSSIGMLVVIGYDFVLQDELFPARLVAVYALVLSFSFLVIFRAFARLFRRALYRYGIGVSNVLIIGATKASKDMIKSIKNTSRTGQRVIGTVGVDSNDYPSFQSFEAALEGIKEPIHSIIQTELYSNQAINNEILKHAQQNHISYRFIPGNSDLFVGNIVVELFNNMPVIAVHQTSINGWARILKRVFDFVVSLLILIILSPLILLVAIIIKITEPKGDIFLRQTRLTRFDTPFTAYKFRSHKIKYNGLTPEASLRKNGQARTRQDIQEKRRLFARRPAHHSHR